MIRFMNLQVCWVVLVFFGMPFSSSIECLGKDIGYTLVPLSSDDSGIHFEIGYGALVPLGTHRGVAKVASVEVVADLEALTLTSAKFTVPLDQMTSGDSKRDCHMREALGIDYVNKQSAFPENHVCKSDFTLPETGVDSVVFPTIQMEFKAGIGSAKRSETGVVDIQTKVELTIHGVMKVYPVSLHVEPDSSVKGQSRVTSQFDVPLKDFSLTVKKAGPIGVADHAVVKVDIRLKQS